MTGSLTVAGSSRAGVVPSSPPSLPTARRLVRGERTALLWERTVGRAADRALDDHVRGAAHALGDAVDVLDLGAGSARALDRLARLDVHVVRYLGVERDAARVASGRRRTRQHRAAAVVRGDIERDLLVAAGSRLVLLAWVLSSTADPGLVLRRARSLAGPDGLVVVAAVTAAADRATSLDAWIAHRWRVTPVDPTVLVGGATRLDVTLRGRAMVATLTGSANPPGRLPPPRPTGVDAVVPTRGPTLLEAAPCA